MTDFHTDMQSLANKIATEALQDKTDSEWRLDAFKQLTVFYGLMLKHEKPAEDDEGATFHDFSERLRESEHGSGAVSGRRRRNAGAAQA